jgi:L-galactose dehydrogenase
MEYRKLGCTGLELSIVGYGASPLGSVFRSIDPLVGVQRVHTAIDLGINFIDVSPYYGETLAETVLGRALKELPRESFYLATKVGRYGSDTFDFSAQRVVESVEESLRRLHVEYIDLIQCHDIEFGFLDRIVSETLPALENLREQGKVGFIGITGLPLNVFRSVIDRTRVDAILSYCHYSLNDSSLGGLVPYLARMGVGIINASPLSMGLLTEKGPPDWHPASEDVKAACSKAASHCKSRGANIAQLAVQYACSNPAITTTLIGTADPHHLEQNVAWALGEPDAELMAEVREILSSIQDKSWPSGLAENR